MFTGIVQALGTIQSVAETAAGRCVVVALEGLAAAPIACGDSICVSGVCLTVVKIDRGSAHFDVIAETLQRTTLGGKKPRDRVNLELSLRGDSFLGGHFVQGHVDAVARVAAVRQDPGDWRITFAMPPGHMACIVPKGSVTVDGVSMTIAAIQADTFTLAVIPTTLENTTLGALRPGDHVNVETDILARTVVHYLRQISAQNAGEMGPAGDRKNPAAAPGITLAKLQELGMA